MTPKETKAYRAALVRIVKNAGQVDLTETPIELETMVRGIGLAAPSVVSAHLMRLIKQRAGIWTRYNNSGGKMPIEAMEERCDGIQAVCDSVLALFGIAAQWDVGTYPLFAVNGRSDNDLTRAIRESFQGKATR